MLTGEQYEELKQIILDIPPPVQIIDIDGNSIVILECEQRISVEHSKGLEKHFAEIAKVKKCIVLSDGIKLKQVLKGPAIDIL